jgi:predicted nucleic acid-binding protein
MNLVDSSGWLEYFTDGANAKHFAAPLKGAAKLVVPTIVLYEVFKVVLRERGESDALQSAAGMRKGRVVELNDQLALAAARLSLAHRLPMADSIILATAKATDATIWTQDDDFKALPGVKYFAKATP